MEQEQGVFLPFLLEASRQCCCFLLNPPKGARHNPWDHLRHAHTVGTRWSLLQGTTGRAGWSLVPGV